MNYTPFLVFALLILACASAQAFSLKTGETTTIYFKEKNEFFVYKYEIKTINFVETNNISVFESAAIKNNSPFNPGKKLLCRYNSPTLVFCARPAGDAGLDVFSMSFNGSSVVSGQTFEASFYDHSNSIGGDFSEKFSSQDEIFAYAGVKSISEIIRPPLMEKILSVEFNQPEETGIIATAAREQASALAERARHLASSREEACSLIVDSVIFKPEGTAFMDPNGLTPEFWNESEKQFVLGKDSIIVEFKPKNPSACQVLRFSLALLDASKPAGENSFFFNFAPKDSQLIELSLNENSKGNKGFNNSDVLELGSFLGSWSGKKTVKFFVMANVKSGDKTGTFASKAYNLSLLKPESTSGGIIPATGEINCTSQIMSIKLGDNETLTAPGSGIDAGVWKTFTDQGLVKPVEFDSGKAIELSFKTWSVKEKCPVMGFALRLSSSDGKECFFASNPDGFAQVPSWNSEKDLISLTDASSIGSVVLNSSTACYEMPAGGKFKLTTFGSVFGNFTGSKNFNLSVWSKTNTVINDRSLWDKSAELSFTLTKPETIRPSNCSTILSCLADLGKKFAEQVIEGKAGGITAVQPCPAGTVQKIIAPSEPIPAGCTPGPSGTSACCPSSTVSSFNFYQSPTLTAQQIDAILSSYNSPAKGNGQSFYDLGVKYGVDPAALMGQFMTESTLGTNGANWANTKSIGNITFGALERILDCASVVSEHPSAGYFTASGGIQHYKFNSWEDSAEYYYCYIKNSSLYGKAGYNTPEQILPMYIAGDYASKDSEVLEAISTFKKCVTAWRQGNLSC